MSGCIFERHELKYLVNAKQRKALEQAMAERMTPDTYGESTICNIYFDTPDFRLIRRSLEKPVYKEKLRLRSYGPAAADQEVFLELKKKYKGVVYKRRIAIQLDSAMRFLLDGAALPDDTQIGREITYFMAFYRSLAPAVHLSYDRSALFSKDDPDLRVTFDKNIRWRTTDLSLTAQPGGCQLLLPGQSLMEIKAASAMPLWLTELLAHTGVYQTSFSKYGSAYTSMLQNDLLGGVFCA